MADIFGREIQLPAESRQRPLTIEAEAGVTRIGDACEQRDQRTIVAGLRIHTQEAPGLAVVRFETERTRPGTAPRTQIGRKAGGADPGHARRIETGRTRIARKQHQMSDREIIDTNIETRKGIRIRAGSGFGLRQAQQACPLKHHPRDRNIALEQPRGMPGKLQPLRSQERAILVRQDGIAAGEGAKQAARSHLARQIVTRYASRRPQKRTVEEAGQHRPQQQYEAQYHRGKCQRQSPPSSVFVPPEHQNACPRLT